MRLGNNIEKNEIRSFSRSLPRTQLQVVQGCRVKSETSTWDIMEYPTLSHTDTANDFMNRTHAIQEVRSIFNKWSLALILDILLLPSVLYWGSKMWANFCLPAVSHPCHQFFNTALPSSPNAAHSKVQGHSLNLIPSELDRPHPHQWGLLYCGAQVRCRRWRAEPAFLPTWPLSQFSHLPQAGSKG